MRGQGGGPDWPAEQAAQPSALAVASHRLEQPSSSIALPSSQASP